MLGSSEQFRSTPHGRHCSACTDGHNYSQGTLPVRHREPGSPVTKRSLGVSACTAIVIGNMVGSGFYLSPALIAPYGNLAILAWVVMGAGAICVGFTLQSSQAGTGDRRPLCLHAHGLWGLAVSHGMGSMDFNMEFPASHSTCLRGRHDGPVSFDA